MNTNVINDRLSGAITWLRFPLIFFIIILHCCTVQSLEGNHDLYYKTIYPFSIWLGETGVPGFFFISGFLFYLSKKSYSQKIRTRIRTLLVPYILWNLILLSLYLATYIIGYPQIINGRSITNFNFIDYIRLFWDRGSYDNGNFVPLLCPLWYIRNLLIMSIISPILYYIIRYVREVFLITIAVWWLMTYNNAFIPQTILFFSLGAYFSIFDVNPLNFFYDKKILFLSLFVFWGASDIITHITKGAPINLQVHRFSLIFNIPALLLLADYCIRHEFTSKLLPNAAFIVFCVHYPIVVILRKYCISHLNNATDTTHIVLFFICIIITTLSSLIIYALLDRYCPKIKNILSGNR
ncbi:MAG: acyltransferase [Prevotella sp.]|nr:acyltransferase [Prevotella sp.]